MCTHSCDVKATGCAVASKAASWWAQGHTLDGCTVANACIPSPAAAGCSAAGPNAATLLGASSILSSKDLPETATVTALINFTDGGNQCSCLHKVAGGSHLRPAMSAEEWQCMLKTPWGIDSPDGLSDRVVHMKASLHPPQSSSWTSASQSAASPESCTSIATPMMHAVRRPTLPRLSQKNRPFETSVTGPLHAILPPGSGRASAVLKLGTVHNDCLALTSQEPGKAAGKVPH